MKTLMIFLMAFAFNASVAMANGPIELKAQSGEKINIWYGLYYDQTQSEQYATGVHVKVDNGISGTTRVVVINNCTVETQTLRYPSSPYVRNYQEVFNCRYGDDGTWVNDEYCSQQKTDDFDGSTTYPSVGAGIEIWFYIHGGSVRCSQQIAVSPTPDQWLVDPVKGQHNFEFRIQSY